MGLPFDSKRVRDYTVEFGAGGQRLGCDFRLDDGTRRFVPDSEITPEVEQFIASLGSPRAGSRSGMEDHTDVVAEVALIDFDGTRTIYSAKMPLPEFISNSEADEGILVRHSYVRSDHRDEQGRIEYVERN